MAIQNLSDPIHLPITNIIAYVVLKEGFWHTDQDELFKRVNSHHADFYDCAIPKEWYSEIKTEMLRRGLMGIDDDQMIYATEKGLRYLNQHKASCIFRNLS